MIQISRRRLLGSAVAGLASASLSGRVFAQAATPAQATPFTLPPLPYAPNANEPNIDTLTMTIHHDRHHAAYVSNLNAAAKDYPQLVSLGVPGMLSKLGELPDAVRTTARNNGGGHVNHTMFWTIMGGNGAPPTGPLAEAITRDLGGMDAMKADFSKMGLGVFGSGWVFVTVSPEGKLALVPKPNQDTPLMDGTKVLMGNDMWEHAYYLKYQNRRADYLAAWWNVVNWNAVAARYAAARDGTLSI
jgi:Fe-Mn family superoxide dismutase